MAAPSSPGPTQAASEGEPARRPQPRRLAWQDAELALAALQARLVGALGDKALAEERLVAAQAAATRAEVRAEGALAAAREEGSTRVAALEATIARLSARSDLAAQVRGNHSWMHSGTILAAGSINWSSHMHEHPLTFVPLAVQLRVQHGAAGCPCAVLHLQHSCTNVNADRFNAPVMLSPRWQPCRRSWPPPSAVRRGYVPTWLPCRRTWPRSSATWRLHGEGRR